MKEAEIFNFEIDLVFKYSESIISLKNLKNKNDNLIFEHSFWEKTFLCWIKTIILEKQLPISSLFSDKTSFSLSIEILSNFEIANINKKWLNKTGSTDVLSFPIFLGNDFNKDLDFLELGDLFISLEKAIEQSNQYQHSIKREMLWLASHGFLHLLGWEHKNKKELDDMLNFQEYLISKLS